MTTSPPTPSQHLQIHHLHYSQSERIPWLLHELRLLPSPSLIPYTLTLHHRAPLFSPPALAALHPLHAAPVLQDGALTLAESGAIVEYILDVYAPGSPLKLRPGEDGYADFLYWWHWSNSGLQATLMRCATLRHLELPEGNKVQRSVMERLGLALAHLDARVKASEWLAGKRFTAADVMIVFSLTTMRRFWGYDLSGYEGILGYLRRIGERKGYQESMAEADAGMDWKEAMQGPPPRPFLEVRSKV